ncbi:MAG: hypothetical protein ACREN7_03235, partial [Candidatus Dormibacteria bacterium]
MAQLTWPGYTTRVALSLNDAQPRQQRRRRPRVAGRLRWITVAGLLLAAAPILGALTTPPAKGPASPSAGAIAQLAAQARGVLSVTDYQLTLPLQESKVVPPPPPAAVMPYGAAFWEAV